MTFELVVRTSALLLAASTLAALLRRAAPATRHLIWSLAVGAVLLAPFLGAFAPRLPIVPSVPIVPTVSFEAVPAVLATPQGEPGTGAERSPWNLGTIGTLGTLGVGSWFLFCWILSGLSVWRGSQPAPEIWLNEARVIARRIGLTGPVAVRQLRKEASPHVAGFFESVVMLPPSACAWPIESRQAAMVHELTHIKRHDRLTQALAQLACAIYWFNPLIWHAAAGLARERECACDDAVLRFGAKASAYASLLLDLARTPHSAWTPATALSMARPSAIEGRLLSILAEVTRVPRRSTRWLIGAALIAITATVLGAEVITPLPLEDPSLQPRPIATAPLVMALDDRAPSTTPASDVIPPLLNALKDPDSHVREKAAIGLAFRRDPRIVDPLLVAIDDRDSHVREKAAIALGASGDPRAVAALTKAMKDVNPRVREKAVGGLILLGFRSPLSDDRGNVGGSK